MAERGLRLKLGAFIAGSLAVLAGLVVFFGRAPELFSNKARYDILFPEAPGIAPGHSDPQVRRSHRPGRSIDLDAETRAGPRPDSRRSQVPPADAARRPPSRRGLLSGDTAIDFLPRARRGRAARGSRRGVAAGFRHSRRAADHAAQPAHAGIGRARQRAAVARPAREGVREARKARAGPKLEIALDEFTGLAKDARGFMPELREDQPALPEPARGPTTRDRPSSRRGAASRTMRT